MRLCFWNLTLLRSFSSRIQSLAKVWNWVRMRVSVSPREMEKRSKRPCSALLRVSVSMSVASMERRWRTPYSWAAMAKE